MIKTLYFAEGNNPSDGAGDAFLLNAADFIAMGTGGTTVLTKMYFMSSRNDESSETVVTLTHCEGRGLEVIEDVCKTMASEPKDGFIVIADEAGGKFCSQYITECDIAVS